MAYQNESLHKISSKFNNEKVYKSEGKGFGRGGIKNNANITNAIPKGIYVARVIEIRKKFKIRVWEKGRGNFENKNANVTNGIPK